MHKIDEKMENFTSEFQNDKMGILELNIQMNYAIFKKIAASSEHLNNLLHDLFYFSEP